MWPFCPQLSFGLSTELTHICPTSYKVLWIAITNFLSFDCPFRTDTLHNCYREFCQQNVLFRLNLLMMFPRLSVLLLSSILSVVICCVKLSSNRHLSRKGISQRENLTYPGSLGTSAGVVPDTISCCCCCCCWLFTSILLCSSVPLSVWICGWFRIRCWAELNSHNSTCIAFQITGQVRYHWSSRTRTLNSR